MDNSSYQEARLQLIKMFNKPSDFRHIIFWYDPNGDFLDDIKADSFDEAKIVIYENNPFTVKTLLEIEDTCVASTLKSGSAIVIIKPIIKANISKRKIFFFLVK